MLDGDARDVSASRFASCGHVSVVVGCPHIVAIDGQAAADLMGMRIHEAGAPLPLVGIVIAVNDLYRREKAMMPGEGEISCYGPA